MKFALPLALVVLASGFTTVAFTESVDAQSDPDQQVNVGLHKWVPAHKGDPLYGGIVVETLPKIRSLTVATSDPAATIDQARQDPNVRFSEPDLRAPAPYTPAEPGLGEQWSVNAIDLPKAWDASRGTTDVVVAMIDGGYMSSHEELNDGNRFLQGYDFVNDDPTPEDQCDHGTAGTSLLAGAMYNGKGLAGTAQVSVLPIKIYYPGVGDCFASYSDATSAIMHAADSNVHIISIQWQGTSSSTMLDDAIAYAYGKGIIIVASAGNYGNACGRPSCVAQTWIDNGDKAIVIGAATPIERAHFSSVGPEVDVIAPGWGLYAASTTSPSSYRYYDGTSFSTPLTAGVVALMKSANPAATRDEITQRLLSTARDMGPVGKDPEFGAGMIDAGRAVAGWPGAFDAHFSVVGGDASLAHAQVDANHPINAVNVRVNGGSWSAMQLSSDGLWRASVNAPDGSKVQFRATDAQGATDASRCYQWPFAPVVDCPTTTDPVDPTPVFTHKGGNEWWVEVAVTPTPVSVGAMDTGGNWVTLEKKSWGNWARSFHIEPGHQVKFRATFSNGTTLESCWFTHPAGLAQCPTNPGPEPTPTTFTHKGGNEWWLEARVEPQPATVQARDTNGNWVTLTLRDWGNWAGSFHIQPGHQVQFRATYADGKVVESCWFTHPGGAVATCATGPTPPAFDATFSGVKGNEWWVEATVKATGGTLARVDARVNGGTWIPLELKSWGSWAKSIHAPRGSTVEFRATASDGRTDVSSKYVWPPA